METEKGEKCIDRIRKKRLDKYFTIGQEAFAKAKAAIDDSSVERKAQALDFLNMARCYIEDAKHFTAKGNYVNAYGALNYAHGWLDAGARLQLFKVKDSRLFTVDDCEDGGLQHGKTKDL